MRRIFLFAIALLTLIVTPVLAQGPDPSHDGEFAVPGLNDTVEILRDEWGVPHIYASNTYDLFFAQGYTQAMDRWWQMEFFRATASGRIEELTGYNDGLIGTDAYLRIMNFRAISEAELETVYDDTAKAMLQAFADGVNAYIFSKDDLRDLAVEYGLLRLTGVSITLQEWTPVDSLIWGKLMALQLGGNSDVEEYLSMLSAYLSPDMLADYAPAFPYGEKPTIVFPEDLPLTEETLSVAPETADAGIHGLQTDFIAGFELSDLNALPIGNGIGVGSNNWVAGGSITESGLPLMANDMHLGLSMPSIWYEIGLHCQPVSEECPYNVAGFAFAPAPFVIAGHNDNISWALTNVGPDTQDLYLITVNPDNPLQYEWDGEWRDMTVRDETINFGDGTDSITFTVRETHLGPIMNDQLDTYNNVNPVALRWTSLQEPGSLFMAFEHLARAENWDDFREALRYWDTASQNVIYADVEGNIGYQMPGRIPIRAPGHTGELPVPGNTSDYEWRGYIPFDNLPRIFNPARGFIASANQIVVPPEYYDQLAAELGDEFGADANYVIHRQAAIGYRGDRIVELLEELQPHNIATFEQMHGDNLDGSAREILPYYAELTIEDEGLAAIRDWLVDWDYQMHMDSPQAALWAALWSNLAQNLFNDELSAAGGGASGDNNEFWAAYLLMDQPDNAWWDDIFTGVTETRDDILLASLEEAYAETVELLGEDHTAWRWGQVHTLVFVSDPIGQSGVAPLEAQVNRGPVETSGTNIAVNATSWGTSSGDFSVKWGPSERAIYDLSDWDNSVTMHTTGQSGHPASDHYDDMIDPWRFIEYHPMLWSREAVEASAVKRMTLTPGA